MFDRSAERSIDPTIELNQHFPARARAGFPARARAEKARPISRPRARSGSRPARVPAGGGATSVDLDEIPGDGGGKWHATCYNLMSENDLGAMHWPTE